MVAQKNLKTVNKPSRYLGGEMGISIKSKQNTRVVLLVPTVYEDAMSNSRVTSIYNQVNTLDGVWLERIFTPMLDYENVLRRENENLPTLESGTNLKDVNLILVLNNEYISSHV